MIKNMVQSFTVDFLYLFGIVFMFLYLRVTENPMDVFYLIVITVIYFKMKFYQWKKYH